MILFSSCENVNLEETQKDNTASNQTTIITTPLRTGNGTMAAPYTVTDVLQKGEALYNQEVWVIGYAVGTAYNGMNNAVFTPPFQHDSNILLANSINCTETAECVPVKLIKKKLKEGISLQNLPTMYQQCLMIQGTIGKYLNTSGIIYITADTNYRWFEGFTIPTSTPSEWEQDTIKYTY